MIDVSGAWRGDHHRRSNAYLGPHFNHEKKHDTAFMLADLEPLLDTHWFHRLLEYQKKKKNSTKAYRA